MGVTGERTPTAPVSRGRLAPIAPGSAKRNPPLNGAPFAPKAAEPESRGLAPSVQSATAAREEAAFWDREAEEHMERPGRASPRRTRCAAILAGLLALCSGSFADANDSTAELTTGGLVLAKTADIEMRSEDLAVSEKQIDVRYRFFNRAAQDVTVTVAFPMPEIAWEGPDTNVAVPVPDSPNFLDFHTFVDGREVVAQDEQKAFAGGIDVSARLQALGVPLAPQRDATEAALDALTPAKQDELVKADIATPYDYDVGKGMEHHLAPRWTLKSSFFWRQTFPAGKEVAVEHRYRPSVGETVGTMLGSPKIDPQELSNYEKLYCVDKDFLASAKKAERLDATGFAQEPFFERRIAYVLTTGANWAGPIGDFHLTVDKGAPGSLVSFCADGVKKIGPTLFEVRHANFTPMRDLHVLILHRPNS
jgi:hypothetical protein